ncbi:unnamed protein product [Protopolystoma xenopodis]|uniref:Uncharacterized protein n=1 Tax=Protopolystoma xenopodis TaxID=117903 RepID=A0A3S5BNW3_9PLAT|nr:unnamed protein product [Protopolystoma xenopodis]
MSDEVGALVFDFGSHSLRGGFAGEDSPKIDIPSVIGIIPEQEKKPKRVMAGHNIMVANEKMELSNFMKDGLIEDFDHFENVVDYMVKFLTPTEITEHPILFSEPAWNTKAKREKVTEILFEKFKIPAFYVAKNAALTCFANGRHTGLVLDCGSTYTSAIPVYDGLVLSQCIVRSPLAGDFIVRQAQRLLVDEFKVDLVPYYRVESKASLLITISTITIHSFTSSFFEEVVKDREPARWKEKKNLPKVTESYDYYMTKLLLQDFVASVLQVSDDKYDQSQADTFPMISYEFPNGFNIELGHERFHLPESLFDPSILPESKGNSMFSMSHIVASSFSLCDIDIRPSLYGNVVVVGGTSLIMGFTERLQRDLNLKTPPSIRLKVNFSSTVPERRYSSWIGGSILGSLGTFQQMWISKHEYQEMGKTCVEKKCVG